MISLSPLSILGGKKETLEFGAKEKRRLAENQKRRFPFLRIFYPTIKAFFSVVMNKVGAISAQWTCFKMLHHIYLL